MVKHEDEELGFLADVGDIDSLLSDDDDEDDSENQTPDFVMVNGIKVPLAHGEMVLGSSNSKLRDGVNNVAALQRHLDDISYKAPKGLKRVPWVETLAITSQKTVEEVSATDDIKREGFFQSITLEMTKEALRRLTALGIPFTRPSDYYADMAKSDQHMKKIQGQLEEEQRRIAAVEERKRNKLEKKFAKDKRVEAQKEKKRVAKDSLKELDEWKKNRERNTTGMSAEEDLDKFFDQKDRAKADRDFKAMTHKKKELSAMKDIRKDDDFKHKAKIGGGTGREVFGSVGRTRGGKFGKPGRDDNKFAVGRKGKRRGASTSRGAKAGGKRGGKGRK